MQSVSVMSHFGCIVALKSFGFVWPLISYNMNDLCQSVNPLALRLMLRMRNAAQSSFVFPILILFLTLIVIESENQILLSDTYFCLCFNKTDVTDTSLVH